MTTNCSPLSGLEVIGPSNGGKLVALFAMTTAAAPAFWPQIAFATRAQTPRFTTAMVLVGSLPVGSSWTKASVLQPSDSFSGVPAISLMTLIW